MNYSIKVSDSGSYILVQINDNMTRKMGEITGIEANKLANEYGLDCFLYDLRNSVNVEDVGANYVFANQDMKKVNANKNSKVALLTKPTDRSHDFIETVMRNAGYNVKLFHQMSEAVAWLETK